MPGTPNILIRRGLLSQDPSFGTGPALSRNQSQVDGLVTRFVEEASSPTTLGALMAGGMAYRLGRVGVMGLGSGHVAAMPLRLLSYGIGLGSEVSAFEFTNRAFTTLGAHGRAPLQGNPNLWSWSGTGGWGEGLLSSAVTFGMLKGAGFLGREQNLIFQNAFQSTAMVAGHNVTASLGITPRPEGSLAEQFLHAEVTNLQLGAGMSLVHSVAPGLHALERGLDVSLSVRSSGPSFQGLLESTSLEPLRAGAAESSSPFRSDLRPLILMMSSNNPKDPKGPGSPPSEEVSIEDSPRSRRRADETARVNIIREEPLAPAVLSEEVIRFDSYSELTLPQLLRILPLHLEKPSLGTLEIRIGGEGIEESERQAFRNGLYSFLGEWHDHHPLADDFVLKVALPARDATLLFRREGGSLRVARVVDPEANLVMDDTPDPQTEERAEAARTSIPPAEGGRRHIASTSSQIFERLKKILTQMKEEGVEPQEWSIDFLGLLPGTGEIPTYMVNILKWLQMPSNHPLEGHSIAVVFTGIGKRVVYSRTTGDDGQAIIGQGIEDLTVLSKEDTSSPELTVQTAPDILPQDSRDPGTGAPSSSLEETPPESLAEGSKVPLDRAGVTGVSPMIPPPPDSPVESGPDSSLPFRTGRRRLNATPLAPVTGHPSPSTEPKTLIRVVSDPIYLVGEGIDLAQEAKGLGFEIVYTGEKTPMDEEYDRFETQGIFFSKLEEGQRFRIHLTHEQRMLELIRQGDKLVRITRPWFGEPTMASARVQDWTELIHTFLHFVRQGTAHQTATIKYMGEQWSPEAVDRIAKILEAHPLAEGQSIQLNIGRAGPRIRFYAENHRMMAEITEGESVQDHELFALSEPENTEK